MGGDIKQRNVFVCVNQFRGQAGKKENELIPIVNILKINILNLGSQHRRLSSFQAS